jgi:hypothetical protein
MPYRAMRHAPPIADQPHVVHHSYISNSVACPCVQRYSRQPVVEEVAITATRILVGSSSAIPVKSIGVDSQFTCSMGPT